MSPRQAEFSSNAIPKQRGKDTNQLRIQGPGQVMRGAFHVREERRQVRRGHRSREREASLVLVMPMPTM